MIHQKSTCAKILQATLIRAKACKNKIKFKIREPARNCSYAYLLLMRNNFVVSGFPVDYCI